MIRWIRRAALLLGAIVGVVIVLLAAAIVALQVPSGQAWVARLASAFLSRPGESVTIGRIGLALPDMVTVEGVEVGDRSGPWLGVHRLRATLDLARIAAGEIALRRLDIDAAELLRLPSGGGGSMPPLRIDRLDLAQLRLDPALLGQSVALAVSGEGLAIERARIKGDVALARLDGPGALHLAADYDPAAARFSAKLRLDEPSGLLLERFIGHPLPATAQLEGAGPLADWHGRLQAAAGAAHLDSDLAIAPKGEGYLFAATGTLAAQPLLPADLAALIGSEVQFAATVDTSSTHRLRLDRLVLANPTARISASGWRAAGGAIAATADLALPDLRPVAEWLHRPLAGSGTLHLDLSGMLTRPAAHMLVHMTDAAYGGNSAQQLDADLTLSLADDLSVPDGRFSVSGKGQLAGMRVADAVLPSGFEKALDWTIDLAGDRDLAHLDLRRLQLRDAGAEIDAAAGLAAGAAQGQASLAADDPAILGALTRGALRGAGRIDADFRAELGSGAATARIGVELGQIAVSDERLARLLGDRLSASGTLRRQPDGGIDLDELGIAAQGAQLSGHARMPADLSRIAAVLSLDIPQIAAIAPAAGQVEAKATIDGAWSALRVDGTLASPLLQVAGRRLEAAQIDVSIPDLAERAGRIAARLRLAGGPAATLRTDVALPAGGRIVLSHLELEAGGASLQGALELVPAEMRASGTLTGQIPDLAPFSGAAGMRLSGSATLRAALGMQEGQTIELNLAGRHLAFGSATLDSASVAAQLSRLYDAPRGRATVKLAGGSAAGYALRDADLRLASSAPGVFRFTARLAGEAHAPLVASLSGEATYGRAAASLRLARLDGRYAGETLTLQRPLLVSEGKGGFSFADLALVFGKGTLTGAGSIEGERLSLQLRGSRLPLGVAARLGGYQEVTGLIGLDLAVSGTLAAPRGVVVVTGDALRFAAASRPDLPPLAMSARGEWQAGHVDFRGRVDAPRGAALGFSGSVPLELRRPFAIVVPPDGRLAVKLEGAGDLGQLADLLPLGEDRLSGRFSIDAGVSGTVVAPIAGGELAVSRGHYESLSAGTILSDIDLVLAGNGQRFVLRRFSAGDGGAGRLQGTGVIQLAANSAPVIDLHAEFTHFRLVRLDAATATAGGAARLSGSLLAPQLAADLTLERAEITLPERLPASVPDLAVTRINSRTGQVEAPPQAANSASRLSIALALTVDAPGQVFVRGHGLDSEWRGRLAVGGTSAAPLVTGRLQVVHGTYSLLGKDFAIARGTLSFSGGAKPDPLLDILAQASSGGVTAQILVGGTASAPTLRLTSQPKLPQDEILARVLFGQGLGQITPLQGLQIAQAAAALAGGGGPDVLGTIRRGLGLDRLSIGSSNELNALSTNVAPGAAGLSSGQQGTQGSNALGSSTLSAGKYVAPGVYLGVEQGIGGNQSAVRVETDVTPHITLDAQAGAQGDNSVGLNFKLDY